MTFKPKLTTLSPKNSTLFRPSHYTGYYWKRCDDGHVYRVWYNSKNSIDPHYYELAF